MKKHLSKRVTFLIQSPFLLITILLAISSGNMGIAQCYETVRTTTPTVNIWDWRSRYWGVYYITSSGLATYYNMDSPFYDVQNLNTRLLAQQADIDKDFKPEDGWELIKKDLGTPTQASRAPYVVLYNKHTSKLRVFFLVTQLYSEIGTTDAQQGGIIKIGYVNGTQDVSNAYQSNLLTAYAAPVIPLDQFKRDIIINTPNVFQSVIPYWLYADAPMMYDPCTCQGKGQLFIRAQLVNTAQVDITIKALPYQSPVSSNSVNKNTDFLTGFGDLNSKIEGGVKAANSAGEAVDKLIGSIDKILAPEDVSLKAIYSGCFPKLKTAAQTTGNWVSLIQSEVSAANTVIGLVNFFVSGGKSSAGTQAPAPVMIMNDFKASGTITSQYQKNSVVFAIPGSDQTGLNTDLVPTYNNVLGIFNLLETPTLTRTSHEKYETYIPPYRTNPGFWSNLLGVTTTYQLTSPIKYVLNPALNIDYTASDIEAAFIFTNNKGLGQPDKPKVEPKSNLIKETKDNFRTHFYSLNSMPQVVTKSYGELYGCGYKGAEKCYWNFFSADISGNQQISLKITARLKRRNSTNPNEDIIFVSTFPVKVVAAPVVKYLPTSPTPQLLQSNVQDLPFDYVIPDNKVFKSGDVIRAFGTVTLGKNMTFTNNATVPIYAAGGIVIPWDRGVTLPPNINSLPTVPKDLWPDATKKAPESASTIAAFCNSAAYKVSNRSTAPAGRLSFETIDSEQEASTQNSYVKPNPFNVSTFIHYTLTEKTPVSLFVSDMTGHKIAVLVDNEMLNVGNYAAELKGDNLPSGIYTYTIITNTKRETKRLVKIK